jgi:hypothetical protein
MGFPSVAVPPVMADMEEQINLKVTTNETLTLTCNVTGHPHPNIVWFKGAMPITKQKWPLIKFQDYNRTLVSNSMLCFMELVNVDTWINHRSCFLTVFAPFSHVC